MKKTLFLILMLSLGLASCTVSKKDLKDMLIKNPDILTDAIKANPSQFIDSLNEAVKIAQKDQAKKREEEEKKKLEDSYKKPLEATIRPDETIRGTKGAPIRIVEYSDFQCPFCARGYTTIKSLMKKFDGKVEFIYKHLPLSFHQHAMIGSQYYEAIRLQDAKKAFKFHDKLYEEKKLSSGGEAYLKKLAKKVGADMKKLAKDLHSDAVKNRISEDLAEAQKFGFQGTPGFLVNGIPVKGAYPQSHFEGIIEELKKRGKLKL